MLTKESSSELKNRVFLDFKLTVNFTSIEYVHSEQQSAPFGGSELEDGSFVSSIYSFGCRMQPSYM